MTCCRSVVPPPLQNLKMGSTEAARFWVEMGGLRVALEVGFSLEGRVIEEGGDVAPEGRLPELVAALAVEQPLETVVGVFGQAKGEGLALWNGHHSVSPAA